jgi:hypothetical protein
MGGMGAEGNNRPEDSVRYLDPELRERVTVALRDLVAQAGGPNGAGAVPTRTGRLHVLRQAFVAWADLHGEKQRDGWIRFGPEPGFWHLLQGLYPITKTARWDGLRKAVLSELERAHGWRRESPPRGSVFLIPPSG